MAKDIEIDLDINVKGEGSIKDLNNAIKEVKDSLGSLSEESQKDFKKLIDKINTLDNEIQNLGKSGDKAKKGLESVGKGFNGIGLAIKASGIGLVIGLFSALKTVLEGQQPILDAIDTAFTAIGLVITAVSNALSAAFESTSKANGGFDATKKVISGLMTIALLPFKLLINSIKAVIVGAQLTWEQSFFGKGDPKRIKELKGQLTEIKDDMVKNFVDTGKAVKSVIENAGEAASEIGGFISASVDNISKIDAQALLSQAKRTTELKNQAMISKAINAGYLEQYDALAEKQRQIRDNDQLTISDRIIANDKLGATLEKQQGLMIKNANLGIQAAQLELAANNTVENKVKLIEAQNEKLGVLATIEGFRSEQIVNRIALEKEQIAINQTLIDGTVERATIQRDFETELIELDTERLNKQLENIKVEETAELTRLQKIRDNAKVGTQARADADNEYFAAKQDFENRIVEQNKEISTLELERIQTDAQAKAELQVELDAKDIEAQRTLMALKRDAALADVNLTENEILLIKEKYKKESEKLDEDTAKKQQEANSKRLQMASAAFSVLQDATTLFTAKNDKDARKQFQINKALSLSSAFVNTALAVTGALTAGGNPIKLATGAQFVEAGIAAAAGAVSIAKIAGTQFSSTGGGGGPVDVPTPAAPSTVSSSASAPLTPSFGLFGNANNLNNVGEGSAAQGGTQNIVVTAVVSETQITQTQANVAQMQKSAEL